VNFYTLAANQPFFDSVGVDPGRGLITNLECAVKFLGVATLRVKITNIQQEILNETAHLFTVVDWHGINVSHSHRVKVIKEGDNYRVAPDIGVQSAFHCDITLDGNIFTYSVRREFDGNILSIRLSLPGWTTVVLLIPGSLLLAWTAWTALCCPPYWSGI